MRPKLVYLKFQGRQGTSTAMAMDLFGSILFHALPLKVNMRKVLWYPLTPVPLSLPHPDGTMQNTPKSNRKQLLELEKRIISWSPGITDARIVNKMFFPHLFVGLPLTQVFFIS